MKYLCFILAGFLFCLACTSENNTQSASTNNKSVNGTAENPDINIHIKNMPATKVYLIGSYTGQNYRADSSMLDASGNLQFKRNEPYKSGMLYVVFPDGSNLQLLIDKDQTMNISTDAADLIGTIQVEGNIDTELLYQSMKFESDIRSKLGPINQQLKQVSEGSSQYQTLKSQQEAIVTQRKNYLQDIFDKYPNTLFTSYKKAGQNPEVKDVRNPDGTVNSAYQVYLYRIEFWNDVDFSDDRLLYTPVITNKLKRYVEQLTPQNPDSINNAATFIVNKVLPYPDYFKYFANYITLQYEPTKTELMDSEKVYVHMIQNYFTKDRAFWADSMTVQGLQMRAYEMSASLTGKKGPDVRANNPNGELRSIYDIKSDYIVVYMFTPTCEHCMVETPKLVEWYKTWKNKSVEVFAIGVDTNDQEWKDYINKTGMNWTNVYDPTNRAIYAKYYVDVTPEIYVLDPDRIIIAKNLKVDQLATVIEQDRAGG